MQKNKLGTSDIFIVSKYLETIQDFENIERATKKAKDLTYKFKFNPIELDLYSRKLFKNIETFHLYKKESNHFEEEEQLCQMDITFFLRQENGLYQKVTESHTERVYEPELLELWLNLSGFDVLGIYQELSELPLEPDSHRAVFVARRRAMDDLSDDLQFDDLETYNFELEE